MRKMMKRALAITLSLVLALSTGIVMADAPEEAAEVSAAQITTKEFDALKAMGLLTDEFMALDKNAGLTRAQFVGALYKLAGFAESKTLLENPFTDVNENTPNASAILYFYHAGFINGTSASTFSPNEGLTYTQAFKIMVDLLGYKDYTARIMGPYPTGYLNTATRLELIDGINPSSYDDMVSAEAASVLLYNYATSYLAEDVTYSSDGTVTYEQSDRYPLSAYHKIYYGKGVMNDNGLVSLTAGKPDAGKVTIGNLRLRNNGSPYTDYLGCQVKYFYRTEDASSVLLWITLDDETNSIVLSAKELMPDDVRYSAQTIVYSKEGSNDAETLDIKMGANYVYNNVLVNNKFSSDKHIKIDAGQMKLIDNDGNGVYDNVIVEEFKNYFATTVSVEKKTIMAKYGQVINVELYDRVFCFQDGESIEFAEIPNNRVLSCVESDDKSCIYIYVNDLGNQETLSKVSSSKGDTYYTFESGTYELAYDLKVAISNGTYDIPEVKAGTTYQYFLDKAGDIAAIQSVDLGSMQYAYLIDIAESDISFSNAKGRKLRFVMPDSVIATAETADKVKIGRPDGISVVLKGAALATELDSYCKSTFKEYVVKVAFNKDGQLKEIEFPRTLGANEIIDKTDFTLDYTQETNAYHRGGVFESAYTIVPTTILFVKHIHSDNTVKYNIGRMDDLSTNGTYGNFQVYDCNEYREAAVMKLDMKTDGHTSKSGYVLVDEVVQSLNRDGEPEVLITGINKGTKVSYKVSEDAVFNGLSGYEDLKRGDIITIFSLKNVVYKVERVVSLSEKHEITKVADGTAKSQSGGGGHVAYGYFYSQGPTSLILYRPDRWNHGGKLLVSQNVTDKVNVKLSVYDAKNDSVYVGEVDDIYQNSVPDANGNILINDESTRVFLYRSNTQIAEIIAVYY